MKLTKKMLQELVGETLREVVEGRGEGKGVRDPIASVKGAKPADKDSLDMTPSYLRAIIRDEFQKFLKGYKKLVKSRPSVGCRSDDVINFVRTYEKAAKGK